MSAALVDPLVSIITPSLNQGRFIRQTIKSVLTQDYPNIEYWVVDGGSTDETVAILREYDHDPRFHWISEPDGGQSDAINTGLAHCHGELFSWLNADDVLMPGALQRIAAAYHAAAVPTIVYGLARLIDQDGRDMGYCAGQSAHMTLEHVLGLHYSLAQPATFVPTAAIRAVGGIDRSLHYAMDFDLWVKLAEWLPIRHVHADLVGYRLHPTSKTVALSTRFIGDVTEVLHRAAARGLLEEHKASARGHLFAARTYFTPEVKHFAAGLASAKAAIRADCAVAPEAIFIALKALARLALGERAWSWVRLAQVKLR